MENVTKIELRNAVKNSFTKYDETQIDNLTSFLWVAIQPENESDMHYDNCIDMEDYIEISDGKIKINNNTIDAMDYCFCSYGLKNFDFDNGNLEENNYISEQYPYIYGYGSNEDVAEWASTYWECMYPCGIFEDYILSHTFENYDDFENIKSELSGYIYTQLDELESAIEKYVEEMELRD